MTPNHRSDAPRKAPAPRTDPRGAPWPGLIPLRPLTIGEILNAAIRLVRGNAVVLCGLALAIGLLGSAARILVLAGESDREKYLTGAWADETLPGDLLSIPAAAWLPFVISLTVSVLGVAVISALTAVYATEETIGRRTTRDALHSRLDRRWPAILLITAVAAVAILVGLALVVLPGLVAIGVLGLAPAVLVIEGRRPIQALRRSVRLSSPVLWRIVGVSLLALLIHWAVSGLAQSIVLSITDIPDLTTLIATEVAGVIVGAVLMPFTAAVLSVLYIDTRIRSEKLADTLAAAARH